MILGVSFDSPQEQLEFGDKHGYSFRLLSDRSRAIALAYGAAKTAQDKFAARYTYVIGPDGRIREAIETKDPAGQADELLRRWK